MTAAKMASTSSEATMSAPRIPATVAQTPNSTGEESHTIITVRSTRKPSKQTATPEQEEPLVDTTAPLDKRSKKTERLQKRQQKKSSRKVTSEVQSFLDLPSELLLSVLEHLRPSDIFGLLRLNKATRAFVLDNETPLANNIIRRHYWVLTQCFPPPVPFETVPLSAQKALLNPAWQNRIKINRNPFQHIKQIDSATVCTCMSCVLAWNNMNILLDLAHWQSNLDNREPIPIISRGSVPEWNQDLLNKHADVVINAMHRKLMYARILQLHLDTTTRTIIRSSKWRRKGEKGPRPRLYHLTEEDIESGTDRYLERSGPPNFWALYMRDNYYNIEAYVPNRKWSKEEQKWQYYSSWPKPHENDLKWMVPRFATEEYSEERMKAWTVGFKERMAI